MTPPTLKNDKSNSNVANKNIVKKRQTNSTGQNLKWK